jgi:class 3 adenylate cyclase
VVAVSWSRNDVSRGPLDALLRSLATGRPESSVSARSWQLASRLGLGLHALDARLAHADETQSDRIRVAAFFLLVPLHGLSSLVLGTVLLAYRLRLVGACLLTLGLYQLLVVVPVYARYVSVDVGVTVMLLIVQLLGAVCHVLMGGFAASGLSLTYTVVTVPLVGAMLRSRIVVLVFTVSGIALCAVAMALAEQHYSALDALRAAEGVTGALSTSMMTLSVLMPMITSVLSTLYFDVRFASEQRFSDDLLYRIMPQKVAAKLKSGAPRQALVERYEYVTCFFSDIVGYTSMAAQHTPGETIDILDHMYEKMDAVAIRFGVHKVATIGDGYFAVSGCPVATTAVADALKMAQFALAVRDSLAGEVGVSVRIGLHSGPVVAGVIGELAPQFTLIGDTVTIASVVEANGTAGMIHISKETYNLIHDHYECRARKPIHVQKDNDEWRTMQTYWLLGVPDDRGPQTGKAQQSVVESDDVDRHNDFGQFYEREDVMLSANTSDTEDDADDDRR